MTDTSARPQFKKVSKKKIKARLRAPSSSEEEEDETSAMDAIQETRKKRKLLNQVLYKRGTDAAMLLVTPVADTTKKTVQKEEAGLTERLQGTFRGTTGGNASGDGGVLEQKHKNVMEEFIRQNIQQQEPQEMEEEAKEESSTKDMEAKLYAELAVASSALAGTDRAPAEEGDVGAGGAMLGGTGIAEVALPVDDRIETIKATEKATMAARVQPVVKPQEQAAAVLPLSFSVGAGKRRGKGKVPVVSVGVQGPSMPIVIPETSETGVVSSSAGFGVSIGDVSAFPSSYSQNFQLHTQEWIEHKKEEEAHATEPAPSPSHDVEADQERLGFEAARLAARGGVGASRRQRKSREQESEERATDDRVFKNFVTKQRESRR